MAKRTAIGLNEIRKLINVEEKYLDTITLSSTTNQNGTVTYLSGLGQGDNISDREGDSIRILRFTIRGGVFRSITSPTTQNEVVRVVVVRDLQNQGAAPTGGDIFETLGNAAAPYQEYDMLNGPQYNQRFTVVFDQVFTLDAFHQVRTFEYSTTHPCHVKFRGTSGAVADAGNGSYWMLTLSNVATNTPSVDMTSRLMFTDN